MLTYTCLTNKTKQSRSQPRDVLITLAASRAYQLVRVRCARRDDIRAYPICTHTHCTLMAHTHTHSIPPILNHTFNKIIQLHRAVAARKLAMVSCCVYTWRLEWDGWMHTARCWRGYIRVYGMAAWRHKINNQVSVCAAAACLFDFIRLAIYSYI